MKNSTLKYIILISGLVATILLTIALIYMNKVIFETENFKAIVDYKNIKLITNNLIGFSEIIVVLLSFISFLILNNKED